MTSIGGHHVSLRDPRHDDLPILREWMQPHQQWHEMDGPYYPRPTAAEIDQMIFGLQAAIENDGFPSPRTRLVIADAAADRLIGMVTRYWESLETNWLCVGIVLYDPAVRGKGCGRDALGLWTQYLFDTMPELVRMDLRSWSGNLPMIRCAESVGYVEEARFRKARIVRGEYFDGLGFGVLREEWDARYPAGFAASGA